MLIDLDPGDPRPVFRQIADEVRRCVSIGVLKPDEPLPAVRRLAETLKVNANTVQHAYRTLEQDGVVYVKRGLGTFVSPRAKTSGKEPAGGGRAADRGADAAGGIPARPARERPHRRAAGDRAGPEGVTSAVPPRPSEPIRIVFAVPGSAFVRSTTNSSEVADDGSGAGPV